MFIDPKEKFNVKKYSKEKMFPNAPHMRMAKNAPFGHQ